MKKLLAIAISLAFGAISFNSLAADTTAPAAPTAKTVKHVKHVKHSKSTHAKHADTNKAAAPDADAGAK